MNDSSTRENPAYCRWVKSDESVVLGGFPIPSGLFYLGNHLPRDDGAPEACLVNPDLPVDAPGAISGPVYKYGLFLSYSEISNSQRWEFAKWMSGGRKDPAISPGLLFVFFYGLEYRLFKEGEIKDARVIIDEVERLLAIYGAKSGFARYAQKFLFAARALPSMLKEKPSTLFRKQGFDQIPLDVRVHIGAKIARGHPLDCDDAMLWASSIPGFGIHKTAFQCPTEFKRLWALEFASRYPDGFFPKVTGQRLDMRYRASSGAFEEDIPGPPGRLPDIASNEEGEKEIQSITELCSRKLEAYGRFVEIYPDASGTVSAASLLPPELRTQVFDSFENLLSHILKNDDSLVLTAQELLIGMKKAVSVRHEDIRNDLHDLASASEKFDIAIEPDPRDTDITFTPATKICVFRSPSDGAVTSSESPYSFLRSLIDISFIAGASANHVSTVTRTFLAKQIVGAPGLIEPERLRLVAHTLVGQPNAAKTAKLLKWSQNVNLSQRRAIATAALNAVIVAGKSSIDRLRFLETLYKYLDLPVQNIYPILYQGTPVADPTPKSERKVKVKAKAKADTSIDAKRKATFEKRAAEKGGPIGNASKKKPEKPDKTPIITIDNEKLARVREETRAVSALLSTVFVEEPARPVTSKAANTIGVSRANLPKFPKLDTNGSILLAMLLEKGHMTKNEFETRAKELKTLAGGAIERINEWAFDRFDEALIEDEDPVTLSPRLRDQVAALKETSN